MRYSTTSLANASADSLNGRVRKVSAAGFISTVAGTGGRRGAGDGGLATEARLYIPQSVAVDKAGNLYIADVVTNRIYMVDSSGIIRTIAGSSSLEGFGGDGGLATLARLNSPESVAVDEAGNVYIADTGNHRIRLLTPVVAGN